MCRVDGQPGCGREVAIQIKLWKGPLGDEDRWLRDVPNVGSSLKAASPWERSRWNQQPGLGRQELPGPRAPAQSCVGEGGPATSVTRHVHPGTHRGSSRGSDTRPCGALPKVLELLLSSVLWVMGSLGILLSAVSQSSRGSTRSHFILIRILNFGTFLGIQKN